MGHHHDPVSTAGSIGSVGASYRVCDNMASVNAIGAQHSTAVRISPTYRRAVGPMLLGVLFFVEVSVVHVERTRHGQ